MTRVTRKINRGNIKGDSVTGSCSARSNLVSSLSSVSSKQTELPYIPETLLSGLS